MMVAALLLVCAGWQQAQAQRNYQLVLSGAASGTYTAVPAAFGGADFCGGVAVMGDLEIVDDGTGTVTDGCEAIQNDVSGKIALIDRGSCQFGTKALNAQDAGAIAVIICNNNDDPPFSMAPGDFGDQVTIPAFMMAKADCEAFRNEIPNGVSADLEPIPIEFPDVFNVLWGANGEGSFTDSLNGWTVNSISCGGVPTTYQLWQWSPDGDISDQGAYVGGGGLMASPTMCTGAAYFDSDFYDNGGTPGNFGNGPCAAPQVGELISPSIDISQYDVAGVSLVFYQATRQFQSTYIVGWSTDGGVTWDSTFINTDLPVNSGHINELVRVPLPGAAGASDLRIKFRYEGNYYYWMIDDVHIVEQEANNMQVNDFYAIPQNAQFPQGELDPIYFLADIENVGAADQTNVNLHVSIVNDDTGMEVFSADNFYGDVAANQLIENIPFDDVFIPDVDKGSYTGTYTISADAPDFDESNNTQTFRFVVSDSTYAKETGATRIVFPAAGNWDADEAHSWAYGNCFYVTDGDGKFMSSMSFGIGNAANIPDRDLLLTVYKWEDLNGNEEADPDERTRVALGLYTIQGDENPEDLITVYVPGFPDDEMPLMLENDTYYLVMVEYITEDQVDFALSASEEYNYWATVFLTGPDILNQPRYAGVLGINDDLSVEPYSTIGFGYDIVPVVRMNVSPVTFVNEPLSDANKVTLFPNPVSDQLTVSLDMEELFDKVYVRIMDNQGRILTEATYDNVLQSTLQYDVRDYPAGTYNLTVFTNKGYTTRQFVVTH